VKPRVQQSCSETNNVTPPVKGSRRSRGHAKRLIACPCNLGGQSKGLVSLWGIGGRVEHCRCSRRDVFVFLIHGAVVVVLADVKMLSLLLSMLLFFMSICFSWLVGVVVAVGVLIVVDVAVFDCDVVVMEMLSL